LTVFRNIPHDSMFSRVEKRDFLFDDDGGGDYDDDDGVFH